MAGKEFEFGFKIAAFIDGNFKSSFGTASQEIRNLNTKIKDNQTLLKILSAAQKEGIINATSYKNAISKINPEIAKLYSQQQNLIEQQSRLNALQGNMRNYGANALQYAGMAWGMTELIKPAMAFESSMADVRKVVDFDTPQQFKEMSQDILNLSTKIPMAADGLAQIVAAGGQSGIARTELTAFAEAAAKMGVAFDVSADQAGDMMAKWRTAFKMSQSDVVALADKINYLGNTTAASAPLISDVVTRIGPLGAVGGVASGEIAAMGASMVGSGIQSEVAATGIKNLILSLVAGTSATKSQNAAFAELGLSAVDMAQYMQKDAKGAILTVLEAVKQLDPARQASVLQDLFGKESLGAIAPLLSNLDALKKNLNAVGNSANYAGSMEKEFAARAATSENSVQLLANAANKAKIAIGAGLLPAITPMAEKMGAFAVTVGDLAAKYPNLTATLVGGIGVIFTGAAAVNGFLWAFNGLKLAFFGTKAAYSAASLALGKYNILTKTGTVLTYGFSIAQKIFDGSIRGTVAGTKMLGTGFLKLWGILLANPWVALAAAAVGAGWFIYNNWDTIKQWFTTLWNNPTLALQQFCDGVKNMLGGAADWLTEKWNGIRNMLSSPIFGKVNISAAGSAGQLAKNAYGGIYNRGAFLTSFAERDGESAIPHTPNRRNIGLLAATNAIMGNPLGGSNITATFAPQITVHGGGSDTSAQIDSLMNQKMREFEEMLKRVAAQQRRLSYA